MSDDDPSATLRLAADPATPPGDLDALASRQASAELLRAVAANPNASAATLARLAGACPEQVLGNPSFSLAFLSDQLQARALDERGALALAACPRAPGWLLMKLADPSLRLPGGHRISYLLAENPSTPAEVIERLARFANPRLRALLLRHPAVAPGYLASAARSNHQAMRALAAASPRTPVDTLASLALDPFEAVRWAALANPSLPAGWRALLERAGACAPEIAPSPLGDDEVERLLSKNPQAARLLLANARLGGPTLARLAASIRPRHEGDLLLAANPSAPPASLRRLLTHERGAVRAAAQANPSADPALVALLRRAGADAQLADARPTVPLRPRDVARLLSLGPYAARLLALHPCASPRLLSTLHQRHGDDRQVAQALAGHPFSPAPLLEALASHRAGRARALASRRLAGEP